MGSVDRAIAPRNARATKDGTTQKKRREGHGLSMYLNDVLYGQLRRFVVSHEVQTGQRLTHQAILEIALAEYLERNATLPC
jgi:hypothetical protein